MKTQGILLILFLASLPAYPAGTVEGNRRVALFRSADSLNRLAEINIEDHPDTSKFYAVKALSISEQLKYTKGQTDALLSISKYYLIKEDYVKTLEIYYKIIDKYDHTHDTVNLVMTNARLSQFFLLIKDYALAKKYLAIMSRLVQKSKDPSLHGQLFIWLAQYHKANNEQDLAIRNLYLCLPYFQKDKDLPSKEAVYKFLGDAFVQKKMYAQALYNYRLALSISYNISNLAEIAVIYTRIAHIYHEMNNFASSLEYNLSAMRIREKIGHPKMIASSYLNVGEAYWLLGKKDPARVYLEKSRLLAEKIKTTDLLEAIYSQLSDFAKSEKKYADAFSFYMACINYRTKINQDKNRSEILILEANRNIRADELKNDLLNQEILIQDLQIRNLHIQMFLFEVAFIILLAVILSVDTLSRKNRKRKDELRELNTRLRREIEIRAQAERMLSQSEEMYRFLAENTMDVISMLDSNIQRLYISPSCEKFYGYTVDEMLHLKSPLDLVDPGFHFIVDQYLLEIVRSKKSTRYIYKVLRKDGSTFWAESNINPIVDPETNEVKNIITVVRDISGRMKHQEDLSENSRQKDYLLREIHNRVKNNFAILISLMNMQRNQSADTGLSSSLTDLQLRVRTMSLVHEQLYQTQEISTIPFDNYLHHLVLIISSAFNNKRISLVTDIQPCMVAIEMALPLGLIVNELITNAFKYAFPDDLSGTVWIKLLQEDKDKFCITVCDNGIGLPADFSMKTTQSMGSQIVAILAEQIEADLEVSGVGGTCFRILFSTEQKTTHE